MVIKNCWQPQAKTGKTVVRCWACGDTITLDTTLSSVVRIVLKNKGWIKMDEEHHLCPKHQESNA